MSKKARRFVREKQEKYFFFTFHFNFILFYQSVLISLLFDSIFISRRNEASKHLPVI